ncbi:MAG TPA: LacI family DNA-binding transcriptional regulator [Ktedonobacteraceae bacterium]|jgi:DNA-binding LacI/PurR family transcriptional regulator|nr:LacI family DNA-binding transcriptional regulator [Ktedonobacteraceae bacterium]
MPKTTIYDVAKLAGVSATTVSKVLNGTGRISKATRLRVESVVAELQYTPSIIASALKKNQTFNIGLLIPDITNPFYGELARTIEDEALHQNYSVLICSTDNAPERERKQLELLIRKHLDGIIVATAERSDNTEPAKLLERGISVVFIDRVIPNSPYPIVATDHYRGSYLAAEHLIQLGHRRIAILLEPLYLQASLERLQGFAAALKAYAIPFDNSLVYSGGFGAEAGYELARQVLSGATLPTAIFAATDLLAIGALRKLREEGIAVPEQVSLVGYDDIQMARMVSPPLTTIAQPIAALSKQAIALLLSGRPQTASTTLLPPALIVRSSTAPLMSR